MDRVLYCMNIIIKLINCKIAGKNQTFLMLLCLLMREINEKTAKSTTATRSNALLKIESK